MTEERRKGVSCREPAVIFSVLCAALVMAFSAVASIAVARNDARFADLSNRIGIHDIGLTELDKDRDIILARLEDVMDAIRRQSEQLRNLSNGCGNGN